MKLVLRSARPKYDYKLSDLHHAIEEAKTLVDVDVFEMDDIPSRVFNIYRDLSTILKALGFKKLRISTRTLNGLSRIVKRLSNRHDSTEILEEDVVIVLNNLLEYVTDDMVGLTDSVTLRYIVSQYTDIPIRQCSVNDVRRILEVQAEFPSRKTIRFVKRMYVSNVYLHWVYVD